MTPPPLATVSDRPLGRLTGSLPRNAGATAARARRNSPALVPRSAQSVRAARASSKMRRDGGSAPTRGVPEALAYDDPWLRPGDAIRAAVPRHAVTAVNRPAGE